MICNDNDEMTRKKTMTTAQLSLDHNPPFVRVESDLRNLQIPPMSSSFESINILWKVCTPAPLKCVKGATNCTRFAVATVYRAFFIFFAKVACRLWAAIECGRHRSLPVPIRRPQESGDHSSSPVAIFPFGFMSLRLCLLIFANFLKLMTVTTVQWDHKGTCLQIQVTKVWCRRRLLRGF